MAENNRLNEILKIEDENKLVTELYSYVSDKYFKNEDIDDLSKPEQVVFLTGLLEYEVNSGGFAQFLCNDSGNLAYEILEALGEIGASATARLLKRAISIFEDDYPADRDEREAILDEAMNVNSDDFLSELDDEFNDYDDDLIALNFKYITDNTESFI